MADRELGRIDRGQHGQLRVTIESDSNGPCVAIAFWFRKDAETEFAPSKHRITIRDTEILALGRLLRMAYDGFAKENPFGRRNRQPTAVRSQPAATRVPSDVTPGPDDPSYDWSQHL